MDNFEKKLKHLTADGKFQKGKAYVVSLKHDHWCRIFKGRNCNCDPDIITIEVTDGKQES